MADIEDTEDASHADQEESRNPQLSEAAKVENRAKWLRVCAFVILAGAGVFAAMRVLEKEQPRPFDPLNALAYETLAIEEDGVMSRIKLPSNQFSEVLGYLKSDVEMQFDSPLLSKLGTEDWPLKGASILDYEIIKVSLVLFQHKERYLFHYVYPGELDALPSAQEGTVGGLSYRGYQSDQLSLVVWQANDGAISVLIGRWSVKELADIARQGLGL